MIKNNIPDKCYECDDAEVKVRKDNRYIHGKRDKGHDVTIDVDCREKCDKEN